jgi:hypothetical protein
MKLSNLLFENKIDDFKNKYSSKFSKENIEQIVKEIPQKYIEWVGKNIDQINFENNFNKIKRLLPYFDKYSTNLEKTDINQYKGVQELYDAIESYSKKNRRDYEEVQGGKVVFNEGNFFVVNPQTHDASCYYGKGTKWCTSMESDYQFKKYNDEGKLFYILDRSKPTSDPTYKVALVRNFDGNLTFYNALDEKIGGGWIFNTPEYNKIMDSIEGYMNDIYSEQIKIYKDKELKRKEEERVNNLRIQRRINQLRYELQERRLNGEWELNGNCPEVGLEAHGVLEYLVANGDVEVLDKEESEELQSLIARLEEIEDNPDLEDEIEQIEERIMELSAGKIDVYNIVPTGDYYDMTEFEVVDSDLYGNRYAAGTQYDVDSSAKESIGQLIDDIGYDGFSKGLIESHLDEDEIERYINEFYDDDVYQNPEIYLNDEDRFISSEQEEEIEIIKRKITKIQNEIKHYDELMVKYDYDDDTISKIEERIENLDTEIEEHLETIDEIENNPEGEYDPDKIDEEVESLVKDRMRNPIQFLNEFGININDFINTKSLIDDIVDNDGYGNTLSPYDGNMEEYVIEKKWIYVCRID